MNYYEFIANDQIWNNWLVFEELKDQPPQIKPRYKYILCPRCHKFDHDAVFKEGFDSNVKIRGRGDIIATDDGFHCFNDKAKSIIQAEHFKGITFKALGKTGWHVASITLRVKADPRAYELHKPVCPHCKRPAEVTGLFQYESQVEVPRKTGTFFSTIMDRYCSGFFDRPIFATEDVVFALKKAGIKGGMFLRLLNAKEESAEKRIIASGKRPKWPAKSKVFL